MSKTIKIITSFAIIFLLVWLGLVRPGMKMTSPEGEGELADARRELGKFFLLTAIAATFWAVIRWWEGWCFG